MPLTAFRPWRRRRLPAAALGLALLGTVAPTGAQEPFRPLVQGEAPPEFALPDTSGRTVRLSDFRGRVILLTFVSCYTDTCLSVLTDLEPLVLKLGPSRLAALSVCVEVPAALKEGGYAGLLGRCGAGQTLLIDEQRATSNRYLATEFPTSVLIAPDFTVREILRGFPALRDPALRSRIEALARQVQPASPAP